LSCPSSIRVLRSFPTRRSSDLSASLTSEQRRRLWRGGLLEAEQMTPAQRVLFAAAVREDNRIRPTALNPLDWTTSGFSMHPGERSEEHTSELQSLRHPVCRLLP